MAKNQPVSLDERRERFKLAEDHLSELAARQLAREITTPGCEDDALREATAAYRTAERNLRKAETKAGVPSSIPHEQHQPVERDTTCPLGHTTLP